MSTSALTPSTESDRAPFLPPIPETMEDLGLPPSFVEQLALRMLHFKGELTGRALCTQLGLKFSLVEPMLELLKRQHIVAVKSSLGMGLISSVFMLTETGRQLTREYLESSYYTGRTPVPISQYTIGAQMQRPKDGWITPDKLHAAFKHMVVTENIIAQVGPAVNSGRSFLIYGQPGNGKTYLAEALFHLESAPVYIPYAIECQGQVIQVFDPIYHQSLEEPVAEESIFKSATKEMEYDGRWVKIKRPFIISGGELTLEMLDLSYNPASKVYDAPFHVKANNGMYLIDDFGRQKVSPAEVLNRWIVPMERKVDYLSLRSGGKLQAPFETFLIFSTNLRPDQLGDEAFLRRIQYKMFLRSPSEAEFLEIFERECVKEQLKAPHAVIEELFERHYRTHGKPLRRCHPRDLITHAIDLIRFEGLPWELTSDLLDRAFETTFVTDQWDS